MVVSSAVALLIAAIVFFLRGGNNGPKSEAIQLRVDNKRSSHHVEGPNWVVVIALLILALGVVAAMVSMVH